jgi:hypothetical protein
LQIEHASKYASNKHKTQKNSVQAEKRLGLIADYILIEKTALAAESKSNISSKAFDFLLST